MSVSVFSSSELSEIAKQVYRELGEFTFTYQEKAIARQESRHEFEKRDDLDILLDQFRWFWETISVSNQAESLTRYCKYGQSEEITHEKISVIGECDMMGLKELHTQLKLVQYNASKFLNQEIAEKLDRFISQIAERRLSQMEVTA